MSRSEVDDVARGMERSEADARAKEKQRVRHLAEAAGRRHTRKERDAATAIQAAARGFLARERVTGLWEAFSAAYARAATGGGVVQRVVDPGSGVVYLLDTDTGVYEEAGRAQDSVRAAAAAAAAAAGVPQPRGAALPVDLVVSSTVGRGGERAPGPHVERALASPERFGMGDTRPGVLAEAGRPSQGGQLRPIPGARDAHSRAAAVMDQEAAPQDTWRGDQLPQMGTAGRRTEAGFPPSSPMLSYAGGPPQLQPIESPQHQRGPGRRLPEAYDGITPIALDSALGQAAGVDGGATWPGQEPQQGGGAEESEAAARPARAPRGPAAYSSKIRRPEVHEAWRTPGAEDPRSEDEGARWDTERAAEHAAPAGAAAPSAYDDDDDASLDSGQADEAAEAIRLFLPDGSRKRTLRAVVSRALQASKFDSVSALLATQEGSDAVDRAGQPAGHMGLHSLGLRMPTGGLPPSAARRKKAAAKGKGKGKGKGGDRSGSRKRAGRRREASMDDEGLSLITRQPGEPPAVRAVGETGVRDALVEAGRRTAALVGGADAAAASDDAEQEGKADGPVLPPRDPPVALPPKRRQEVCFACWSMGRGGHCSLHRKQGEKARTLPGLEADKSVMACAHWSVEALGRQFRDEAVHEVFSRTTASLRFDSLRQAFHTVTESRHPAYRALSDAVAYFNERKRRLRRRRRWCESLMEEVKAGMWTQGYRGGSAQSRILRLRGTLRNAAWVSKFRVLSQHRFPLPPATGQMPVAPENRVTDRVLADRTADARRRRKADALRERSEMTPRDGEEEEKDGDESGGEGEGGAFEPVVLARARGKGRERPRGSGKGLYTAVPTSMWRPASDSEDDELVLENDDEVAARAADGRKAGPRVRGAIADTSAPGLDDPIAARRERRRRRRRYPRFLTDSEHQLEPMTEGGLLESGTAMRSIRKEGVVLGDEAGAGLGLSLRPKAHRALTDRSPSWREGATEEERQAVEAAMDADRKEKEVAGERHGRAEKYDVELSRGPEGLGGPSHVLLGHADDSGHGWRYVVALPVPDPQSLRRPLVYYPYEPRHVPVPTPEGSALKAAADESRRYEAERPERQARSEAEAAAVETRVNSREAPLAGGIAADGTTVAGSAAGTEDDDWAHAARVIRGDTAASAAPRLQSLTASEHDADAASRLPRPPRALLYPGPSGREVMLDTTTVPSFTFFRRPAPAHDLRCTFFRHTAGREFVFGGLPAQVNLVAWVTTAVPPAFGGMMALRPASVAPVRVPDVVRMRDRGGDVDVRDIVELGGGRGASDTAASREEARVMAWRTALGDEVASAAAGITAADMEPVSEARARKALGLVRFGGAKEEAVWAAGAAERAEASVRASELARLAEEATGGAAAAADAAREPGIGAEKAAAFRAEAEEAALEGAALRRGAEDAAGTHPGPEAALRRAAEAATAEYASLPALRGFVVFDTVDVPASSPSYSLAPLVSPLNDRVPPTVTLSTVAAYHAGLAERRRGERATLAEGREDGEEDGRAGGDVWPTSLSQVPGVTADPDDAVADRERERDRIALAVGMPLPTSASAGRGRGADAFSGAVGPGGAGISVLVVDGDAPLYMGQNRPDQTGEAYYAGFRTAEAVAGRRADPELDASPFLPHEEIVAPNEATPIVGTTTHADRFYPFAVPSTAPSTASDLLYVLLTSRASSNEPCTFTVLGHQDGGEFLVNGDPTADVGPLSMHVYRSLAAAQSGDIEEFRTATGAPYWYNRRSGQTYWEPPLPEAPDEALQEEDEGRALQELLDRERAALQRPGQRLVVRLPDNLYERCHDGAFVHERLLAEDGSLRPDAMEQLEAEAAASAQAEHDAIKDRWNAPAGHAPPESLTHLAEGGGAAAGDPATAGAVLHGGEFVPEGWRAAGRATSGGFAKGAAAEAAGARAAAGGGSASTGVSNGPGGTASDVIAAGPYTQHRMRQYMLAPRQTDAFVQGAAPSVMPEREPDDPAAVGYVEPAAEGADTRGRAAGAAVVAVGQRFAVQRRQADPREAGSAAVADPDGRAAGAGLAREGAVRRERHRVAMMRQAERQAEEAVRAGAAADAAAAGAPMVGALGPVGAQPLRQPAPLASMARGNGAAELLQAAAVSSAGLGGGGGFPHSQLPRPDPGHMGTPVMAGPLGAMAGAGGGAGGSDDLVQRLSAALAAVLPQLQAGAGGAAGAQQQQQQLLQLGLGLGLGIGLGQSGGGGAAAAGASGGGAPYPVDDGGPLGVPPPLDHRGFPGTGIPVSPMGDEAFSDGGVPFGGHGDDGRGGYGYYGDDDGGHDDAYSRDDEAAAWGGPSAAGDGEGVLPAFAGEAGARGAGFDPPSATAPPDEAGGPNTRPGPAAAAADPRLAPYRTHASVADRGAKAADLGAALQAVRPRLVRGFVDKAYTPSTVPQHAEYMPRSSNNNKARVLGVVAPRQIIEDWAAVGFDPWSAGKRLRTTVLVRDIGTLLEPDSGVNAATGAPDAEEDDPTLRGLPPGVMGPAKASLTKQLMMSSDLRSRAARDARSKAQLLLEQIFSYTRNNRYDELEALLAAKHTGAAAVDIDARDDAGNTLLHVSSQNGNKRIAKLALRRGGDINARNNGGNTPLHYAYAYGFDELGEYLKTKGADDTLQNLEGLTPYEGLSKDDIAAL